MSDCSCDWECQAPINCQAHGRALKHNLELTAEIKRLRAEIAQFHADEPCAVVLTRQNDEIVRLRAELALARAAIADAHVLIPRAEAGFWAGKHRLALGADSETPKARKA